MPLFKKKKEQKPARKPFSPGEARRAWRQWNRWVLTAVATVGLFVVSMNVLVDPYQVFRIVPYRNGFTPNEWDNKFAWLKDHPEQSELLLLGSSRMGVYDPRWFESGNAVHSAYNFSKLAARPSDIARLLPALERAGLTPKRIVLGIDVFPFLEMPGDRGPAHYDPPFITGDNRAAFLSRYLFLASFMPSGLRLIHLQKKDPELTFDFTTGLYRTPGLVRKRNKDPKAYDAREFSPPPVLLSERPLNVTELKALESIANWCADHDVEVQAFIHPHHPVIQTQVGERNLAALENAVQKYFPDSLNLLHYTDGLGNNAYLDKKHYSPAIARKLSSILAPNAPKALFSSFSATTEPPSGG